jgi:hypothetical protein
MINEHIILVEFHSNSFNVILTHKHLFKRKNVNELKCAS